MKDVMNKVRGTIEVFRVDGNKWDLIHKQHNLVTYEGADILAKAVAGALNINAMYLVFENAATAVRISEDLNNVAGTYADVSDDRGYVRVSTMGEPVYSSSGDAYNHNEVSFLAVTDGTSEISGVDVEDGTSVFYHSALVSAPDFDVQATDLIFSCADLSVDITKVAGAQVGIKWTLTFEAPTA